jgi:hypothetical protein
VVTLMPSAARRINFVPGEIGGKFT